VVTVKAGVLFNAFQPVEPGANGQGVSAFAILADTELPSKVSYHIDRAIRKFASEVEQFDEKRVALIKKFSDVDEKGEPTNSILPTSPQFNEFMAAYKEIAEVEVTVSDVDSITLASLGDKCSIKPRVIGMMADWFIKE